MIKRIIFDLDNTLIPWEEEYWDSLKGAFKRINYSFNDEMINKLSQAVGEYEKYYPIYKKEDLLAFMEKYANIDLPDIFLDYWLEELGYCAKTSQEIIDTLEYLYQKYDLVVLTNWFTSSQTERLITANILKYFSKVYGADEFLIKPYPESYLMAANGYQLSECLMIGDNLNNDVKGALQLGMKAIYFDLENKYHGNEYQTIKKFSDLKKIL
ncbi:MAG: HAD family hydrolase [Mollicutes bacterium]|nr:HAD family hydrolase [Mollicutes bacterium]